MAKRGRKSKAGKRTKSGQLSRAKPVTPLFDHGTERAQAMQVFYGQDGADAIGRAYRSGFLGTGAEAKAKLDTARRIAGAYWQAYSTGRITCTLGDRTGGSVVDLDHEKIKRREQWLNEVLRYVERMGARSQFDQLVVDVNPDCGPPWLDRLIYAKRTGEQQDIADLRALRAALDPLEVLANGT